MNIPYIITIPQENAPRILVDLLDQAKAHSLLNVLQRQTIVSSDRCRAMICDDLNFSINR